MEKENQKIKGRNESRRSRVGGRRRGREGEEKEAGGWRRGSGTSSKT